MRRRVATTTTILGKTYPIELTGKTDVLGNPVYRIKEDQVEFAPPSKAHQHLNRDGKQETLCGYAFEDIFKPKAYDYRDGFDPKGGLACQPCATKADRIRSG